MTAVFVALAVLVLVGLAFVLADRLDPGVAPARRQERPALPPGPWTAADVAGLRFRVGLRGYRMEDVDAMLAALAEQLPPAPDPDPAGPGEPLSELTSDAPPEPPASTSAG
jgi:DivIVA domain-containing protein